MISPIIRVKEKQFVEFPSQGSVEVRGEAQQRENLLLHGRKLRHMANDLLGQLHLSEGDGHKGQQEALGCTL